MDPQAGQPVQAVPVQNADAANAPPLAQVAPADIPAAPAQQGAANPAANPADPHVIPKESA